MSTKRFLSLLLAIIMVVGMIPAPAYAAEDQTDESACEHSYEAVVSDPTCTAVGYTTYTCSACGHSYVADEVEALGHDYSEGTTCSTCGEAMEMTVLPLNTVLTGELSAGEVAYYAITPDVYCSYLFDGESSQEIYCELYNGSMDYETGGGHETGFGFEWWLNADETYILKVSFTDPEAAGSFRLQYFHYHYSPNYTKGSTCQEQGEVIKTCEYCGYSWTEATHLSSHNYYYTEAGIVCDYCGGELVATPIALDQTLDVGFIAYDYAYVSFVPEGNCYYTLQAKTDAPVLTALYDSTMTHLTGQSDYRSVECTRKLKAGQTYYLRAGYDDKGQPGTATFTVTHSTKGNVTRTAYTAHTETEDGSATYTCGDCGHSWTEVHPAGHSFDQAGHCLYCGIEQIETGTCGENATWELNIVTGLLTVSGTGAMYNYTDEYNGNPAPWAPYRDSVKAVVIGDGITEIGDNTFRNHRSLAEVTLPDTLTRIGYYAFMHCTSLTDLELPEGLTSLEHLALSYSGITGITLPTTLTSFNVTSVGSNPDLSAINAAEGHPTYVSVDGVLFTKDMTTLVAVPTTFSSYDIPEGVTTIGSSAFSGTDIAQVTFPSTLTTLETAAFNNCYYLTSVVLPDTVTSLGAEAFYGCSSLKEIVLPAGLTVIEPYTFYNCDDLEKIVIPAGITQIQHEVFSSCHALKTVRFLGNAPEINYTAFTDCNNDGNGVNVYYPSNDTTWVSVAGQSYGGSLNWFPLDGLVIMDQPEDTLAEEGRLTVLSVDVYSAQSYQWQVSTDGGNSWTDIEGAAAAELSLYPTAADHGNYYRCLVTDADNNQYYSNNARMSVAASVTVTPETLGSVYSVTIPEGSQAVVRFTPAVSGRYMVAFKGTIEARDLNLDHSEYTNTGMLYTLKAGREYVFDLTGLTGAAEICVREPWGLSVDEALSLTLNGDATDVIYFTVPQDGWYTFDNGGFYTRLYHITPNGDYEIYHNYVGAYELEAGERYYFTTISPWSETRTVTVTLRTPQVLNVGEYLNGSLSNGSNRVFYLTPAVSGTYAFSFGGVDCQVFFDEEALDCNEMQMYELDAGVQYVVRLSNGYGEDRNWILAVRVPEAIQPGYVQEITLNTFGEAIVYQVTPAVSGMYTFAFDREDYPDIQVMTADTGSHLGSETYVQGKTFPLQAGVRYYVCVRNYSEEAITTEFRMVDHVTMTPGDTCTATGRYDRFNITVEESGFYVIHRSEDSGYQVQTDAGHHVDCSTSRNRDAVYYLEAGVRYSLLLDNYNGYSEYQVSVLAPVKLEENASAEAFFPADSLRIFGLTAQESGYYVLSHNMEYSMTIDRYNRDAGCFNGLNSEFVDGFYKFGIYLEGGVTTWLLLTNSTGDCDYSGTFTLEKAPAPDSVDTNFIGSVNTIAVGSAVKLYVNFSPSYSGENYTVTVDNDTVAAVVESFPGGVLIEGLAPGQTTVTVTTQSGVVQTRDLQVVESTEMNLAAPVEVTLEAGGKTAFEFFTEEFGGVYVIRCVGDIQWQIVDEFGNYTSFITSRDVNGEVYYYTTDLAYQTTHYIILTSEQGVENGVLEIRPREFPQTLSLPETLTVTKNQEYLFLPDFGNPWVYDYVNWNHYGTYAECSWPGNGYQLRFTEVGTVTVTASWNDLNATCVVTVEEAPPMTDGSNQVFLPGWQWTELNLVPKTDGFYTLILPDGISFNNINDENGTWPTNWVDSQGRQIFALAAGVTYRVGLQNDMDAGTYEVCLDSLQKLELNVTETMSLDPNQQFFRVFSIEEAGYYTFTSSGGDMYRMIHAAPNRSEVHLGETTDENGIFRSTYYLVPGDYLLHYHNAFSAETITTDVTVTKAQAPDTISLYTNSSVAAVGGTLSFDIHFEPYLCAENYTVSFDQEGLVELAETGGTWFMIRGLAVGTVTLTVTTVSGSASTSFTLDVINPTDVEQGEIYSMDVEATNSKAIRFTVAEDGYYVIRTTGTVYATSTSRTITAPISDGEGSSYSYFYGAAGEDLVLFLENSAEEAQTVAVELRKAQDPQAIYLPEDMTVVQNQEYTFTPRFDSFWAYASVTYEWPGIPVDTNQIGNDLQVSFTSQGVSTITATWGELSDSCVVTVTEPAPMTEGANRLTFPAWETTQRRFIPAESGYYTFELPEGIYIQGIVNDDGSWASRWDCNGKAIYWLQGGATYRIEMYNESAGEIDGEVIIGRPQTLEPYAAETVTLDVDEQYARVFTVAETGFYALHFSEPLFNWELLGLEGEIPPHGASGYHNDGLYYDMNYLEAGVQYMIRLSNYSGMENTVELSVIQPQTPSGVSLSASSEVMAVGSPMTVWVNFEPILAAESFSVSLDREDLAEVTEVRGTTIRLQGLNPGTVTLTVTTVSGFTGSLTLEVIPSTEAALGEIYTNELSGGEVIAFHFVAQEDGYHVIRSTGNLAVDIPNWYVNGTAYDGEGNRFEYFHMCAGEEIVILLNNQLDESQTVEFEVRKALMPETLSLPETVTVKQFEHYQFRVDFGTYWAYLPFDFSWSGPGANYWTNSNLLDIRFMDTGTGTVSAWWGDWNFTCEVTIEEPAPLVEGTNIIYAPAWQTLQRKFIPEETGFYFFDMPDGIELTQVLTSSGIWPDHYWKTPNIEYVCLLEAGVEYTVYMNNNWDGQEYEVNICDPQQIALGEWVYDYIPSDSHYTYLFVPETTGYYTTADDNGGSTRIIWSTDGTQVEAIANGTNDEDRLCYTYALEAGKEYLLTGTFPSGGNIRLEINEAPEVQEISIDCGNGTVAEGQNLYVNIHFDPGYSLEDYTVTVEDPAVAEVKTINETGFEIAGLAEGTTTVTVTTVSGKTASFQLTCVKPTALTLGRGTTVNFSGEYYLSFTTREAGIYAIYVSNDMVGISTGWGAENIFGDENGGVYNYYYLAANTTYVITGINHKEAMDVTFIVDKCQTPTTMTLTESVEGYEGNLVVLTPKFDSYWHYQSFYARLDGDAISERFAWGGIAISMDHVGTGTVTIQCRELPEVNATCTVTVKERHLVLGSNGQLTLPVDISRTMYFTPAETGYYTFSSADGVSLSVRDADDNRYVTYRASNAVGCYLTEGVRYTLTYANSSSNYQAFDLIVSVPEILTPDQNLDSPLDYGEGKFFLFTTEDAGYYTFAMPAGSLDLMIYDEAASDESGDRIGTKITTARPETYRHASLEAGKTYLVLLVNYDYGGEIYIRAQKTKTPTALHLKTNVEYFFVDNYLHVSLTFDPVDSYGPLTWTVSDPALATIMDVWHNNSDIRLLAPGELTITATAENGGSGSMTIQILDPETVTPSLDGPTVKTVAPGQVLKIVDQFPSGGKYTLEINSDQVKIVDGNWRGDLQVDGKTYIYQRSYGADTHTIYLVNTSDETQTLEFRLHETPMPEDVSLSTYEVIVPVGDTAWVDMITGDPISWAEITNVSTDNDTWPADLNTRASRIGVMAGHPGTMTIEIELDNGQILYLGVHVVENVEPEPSTDPYLSFRWLNNWDGIWTENGSEEDQQDFGMTLLDEHYMIFYINYLDENGQWVREPVEITTNEYLMAEMLVDLGENIREDDANGNYFYRIRPVAWDTVGQIRFELNGETVIMEVPVRRFEFGFYTAPEMTNEAFINRFVWDPDTDAERVFYFGMESDEWNIETLELEMGGEYATVTELDNGMYKIVVNSDVDFGFDVCFRILRSHKENPEITDECWPGIYCEPGESKKPYISSRWLEENGIGWHEVLEYGFDRQISMPKDQERWLVFYVNYLDENGQWVMEQIDVTGNEYLELTKVTDIEDVQIADGVDATHYYRINAVEWGDGQIYYEFDGETLVFQLPVIRDMLGFYSEPNMTNETYLNWYEWDPDTDAARTFYFGIDPDALQYWTVDRLEINHGAEFVTVEALENGMYAVTVNGDVDHGFHLELTVIVTNEDGYEDRWNYGSDCHPGESKKPYLSFRWLENHEGIWSENPWWGFDRDTLGMTPYDHHFLIFYVNYLDENGEWVSEPVEVMASENLTLEKIMDLEGEQIAEGEANGQYFYSIRSDVAYWDTVGELTCTFGDETLTVSVPIRRNPLAFYGEPAITNEAYLQTFFFDSTAEENILYFGLDMEGWIINDISTIDPESTDEPIPMPGKEFVRGVEVLENGMYAFTLGGATEGFELQLAVYFSNEDGEMFWERVGIWCEPMEIKEPHLAMIVLSGDEDGYVYADLNNAYAEPFSTTPASEVAVMFVMNTYDADGNLVQTPVKVTGSAGLVLNSLDPKYYAVRQDDPYAEYYVAVTATADAWDTVQSVSYVYDGNTYGMDVFVQRDLYGLYTGPAMTNENYTTRFYYDADTRTIWLGLDGWTLVSVSKTFVNADGEEEVANNSHLYELGQVEGNMMPFTLTDEAIASGEEFHFMFYFTAITEEGELKFIGGIPCFPIPQKLEITKQPEDVAAVLGDTVSISVEATGEDLTYQWQWRKNDDSTWAATTVSGNKTDTIQVQATTTRDGYQYRCVITDADGNQIISEPATLTLKEALEITKQPESVTANLNDTVTFTVEATGEDLSYQWQWRKNDDSTWAATTVAGNKTDTIQVQATTTRDGYQYRCVITDADGNQIISEPVTLSLKKEALEITKQPESVTAMLNDTVTFTVEATGEDLTYQWQWRKNDDSAWNATTVSGNKTDTIQVQATTTRDGYQYRCVITDADGNQVISEPAILTLKEALEITKQPESVTAMLNDTVTFTVEATGEDLSYQWQWRKNDDSAWNATTVSGNKTDTIQVQATTTRDGYQYRCVITDADGNQIISEPVTLSLKKEALEITKQPESVTAMLNDAVTFTVEATGEDLTYQWQYCSPTGSWKATTLTGAKTATLKLTATTARNGYQYRCVITDADGNQVISEPAILTLKEALEITKQPESVTANLNDTVTFTVEATGEDLSYQWQWRKNDDSAWNATTVSGNKTDTIQVQATTTRDGYQYRCVITDADGNQVISEPVTLSVKEALEITKQPESVTAVLNDAVTLTVEANGEGLTYQWQYCSPTGSWKATTLTGAKTATLKLTATNARNGYQYRCIITDADGNQVISEAVVLTVTAE